MKKAFTLVELMVVIALIGIFTAISIQIFLDLKRDREVKNFAEQVKSVLLDARQQAVTPTSDTSSKKLESVQVKINTTTNEIKVYKQISNTNYQTVGGLTFSSTSIRLSLAEVGGLDYFNFIANDINKLGQINTTSDPVITATNGYSTYTITINRVSGQITTQKQ